METKELSVSMPVNEQAKPISADRERAEKIYEDLKSTLVYLTCHFTKEDCMEDFLFELGTISNAIIEIELKLNRNN